MIDQITLFFQLLIIKFFVYPLSLIKFIIILKLNDFSGSHASHIHWLGIENYYIFYNEKNKQIDTVIRRNAMKEQSIEPNRKENRYEQNELRFNSKCFSTNPISILCAMQFRINNYWHTHTQPLPLPGFRNWKLNRKSSGLICSILCTSTGKVMDTKRTQLFQQIRKPFFFIKKTKKTFLIEFKQKQNKKKLVDSNISKYDFVHEKRCVDFYSQQKTQNKQTNKACCQFNKFLMLARLCAFNFILFLQTQFPCKISSEFWTSITNRTIYQRTISNAFPS